jgi:hypothetical protein
MKRTVIISLVTYDKEDVDENWVDRTRLDVCGKNWSFSIDPYWNNTIKPWLMTMKGYNKYRDVDYRIINIGWILGWMLDFDKKRNGVWETKYWEDYK